MLSLLQIKEFTVLKRCLKTSIRSSETHQCVRHFIFHIHYVVYLRDMICFYSSEKVSKTIKVRVLARAWHLPVLNMHTYLCSDTVSRIFWTGHRIVSIPQQGPGAEPQCGHCIHCTASPPLAVPPIGCL